MGTTPVGTGGPVFTDDFLTASVGTGGRLDKSLAVLERVAQDAPDVPITVLIDPELLNELELMATGPYQVQAGHNPHPEVVDVADLPDLAGWVDVEDQAIPFVLAVVDRTGGDVRTYRATSQPPVDEESVTGETFYVTKVAEGDWAQKQFPQTAENRWHENAELVAEAVRASALAHRALTVFVAGEVRARAEVVKAITQLDHGLDHVVEIEAVIEDRHAPVPGQIARRTRLIEQRQKAVAQFGKAQPEWVVMD